MARSTKAAPVITREELAASVPEVSLASVTEQLVDSFRTQLLTNDERNFDQARVAYLAHTNGHKDEAIAESVSAALSAAEPGRDPELSVTKGGAAITRVVIVQRRQAWSDLLEAGVTPTVPAVRASLSLTQSGAKGLSDLRKKLQADTKALAEEQRELYFIEEARRRFDNLKKGNAEKKAEEAAKKSADSKSEDTSEPVQLDTAEQVVALIKAELARPWSDEDKALIVASLTEALSKLG